MTLNDEQKQTVARWVSEGAKLSDIQKRLISELGLTLTYMQTRFLVDDLKLALKDPEPPKRVEPPAPPAPAPAAIPAPGTTADPLAAGAAEPGAGRVSVVVDQLAQPGSLVSGSVTFSDGNTAGWYLDQMGRLGLAPKIPGYKPSAADVQSFQHQLEAELARLGL